MQPLSSVGPHECTASFYLLPGGGLELWGSRLHLSGCTMSSVLWELACSIWPGQMPRKSALLLPFRTPAGPAHLVYSASTRLLSALCLEQRWMHPRTHRPCVILNKRARTPTQMFGIWGPVLPSGCVPGSHAGAEAKKARAVHSQLQLTGQVEWCSMCAQSCFHKVPPRELPSNQCWRSVSCWKIFQ